MQIKVFTIPVIDQEGVMEEMNTFLRSKKVLQVTQKLLGRKPGAACWTFVVTYVDDVGTAERFRGKIDYKEVLGPAEFNRFSAMRDIRKALALENKVPPYVIFTDYELSEMAKLEEITLEAMRKVKGIGESKVEKYGNKFLTMLKDEKGG